MFDKALNYIKQKLFKKRKDYNPISNVNSKSNFYTVKKGDTIDEIANLNNLSVNKLILYNDLDSLDLETGQILLLEPYFDSPFFAQDHIFGHPTPSETPTETETNRDRD